MAIAYYNLNSTIYRTSKDLKNHEYYKNSKDEFKDQIFGVETEHKDARVLIDGYKLVAVEEEDKSEIEIIFSKIIKLFEVDKDEYLNSSYILPVGILHKFEASIENLYVLPPFQLRTLTFLTLSLWRISNNRNLCNNNLKSDNYSKSELSIQTVDKLEKVVRILSQEIGSDEYSENIPSEIVIKFGKYSEPIKINHPKVVGQVMTAIINSSYKDDEFGLKNSEYIGLDHLKDLSQAKKNCLNSIINILHQIIQGINIVKSDAATSSNEMRLIYELIDFAGLKHNWEHYSDDPSTLKKIRQMIE